VRNTITDMFYMTSTAGEPKPEIDFAAIDAVQAGPAAEPNDREGETR
jgi:hypothetical protein